jgi:hypothetical protein
MSQAELLFLASSQEASSISAQTESIEMFRIQKNRVSFECLENEQ